MNRRECVTIRTVVRLLRSRLPGLPAGLCAAPWVAHREKQNAAGAPAAERRKAVHRATFSRKWKETGRFSIWKRRSRRILRGPDISLLEDVSQVFGKNGDRMT